MPPRAKNRTLVQRMQSLAIGIPLVDSVTAWAKRDVEAAISWARRFRFRARPTFRPWTWLDARSARLMLLSLCRGTVSLFC